MTKIFQERSQKTLCSFSWSMLQTESFLIWSQTLGSILSQLLDSFSNNFWMQSLTCTTPLVSAIEIWNQRISWLMKTTTLRLLTLGSLSQLLELKAMENSTHTKELLDTCHQNNMLRKLTAGSKLISLLWLLSFSWWSPNASHLMKQKLTINSTDLLLATNLKFSGESLKRLFQWAMILRIWLLECSNSILMQDILLMKFSFIHGCKARHQLMMRYSKSLSKDHPRRRLQVRPRIDRCLVSLFFVGCACLLNSLHPLSSPHLLPSLSSTLKTPKFFMTL